MSVSYTHLDVYKRQVLNPLYSLHVLNLLYITIFTCLSTVNQRPKPATQPGNIKVNTAEEEYTFETWVSAHK